MRACVDDVDGDDKSLLLVCDNDGDDNSLQYRCAHIKSTYAETLVLLMSGNTQQILRIASTNVQAV